MKIYIIFFTLFNLGICKMTANENIETIDINFQKEISENKLQLTIYYNGPKLIRAPLSDQEIRNGAYDYKIVVNPTILLYYLDMLNYVNKVQYKKCDENLMIYARAEKRILCEFRNKNDDLLLSFSHGNGDYVILNRMVIKKEKALYYIIKFFLPRNIEFYGEQETQE